MDQLHFEREELPEEILAKVGLTPDMLEDLPQSDLLDIEAGGLSPALRLAIEDRDGVVRKGCARFRLTRQPDGSVGAEFFPSLETDAASDFSSEEREALLQGRCIVKEMPVGEDTDMCACQLDHLTGRMFYIPVDSLLPNIQRYSSVFNLLASEVNRLRSGHPLQVSVDGNGVTMGIDLLCSKGVRCGLGSLEEWQDAPMQNCGKRNFGVNGCWCVDDDGAYEYVPEEEYTDEMWDELSASASQNLPQTIV